MYQTKFLKQPATDKIKILVTSDIHYSLDKINALGEWLSHKKKKYVPSLFISSKPLSLDLKVKLF